MKAKLVLALLATAISVHAVDTSRLIEDLVRVESNGNSRAVGDSGKAFGILQIHAITVQDANRIAGTRYTHNDMFDPANSRHVASIVLNHYAKHIKRTTGREATRKELAFIWNGGGGAWKRVAAPKSDSKQRNLERYWSKVSAR